MSDAEFPRTHNSPPIVIPTNEDLLKDLQTRYPDLDEKLAEFDKALATYPESFTLADEDIAASLGDLLGKMRDQKAAWAGVKKNQKKPWDGLVKVVQNFFGKGEDKIESWQEVWKPRHQQFLDLKAADSRRKAEEALEAQRKEAERLRAEAEASEKRARDAEAARLKAEQEAEEARARAEEEGRKAKEAEARAAQLEAEEKARAADKKKRDRAEVESNTDALRSIKRNMKDAERLNTLAEAEEASDDELAMLDLLVRPGGTISILAGPVASSALLDDDQKADVETTRARLAELRAAADARFGKRERAKREKARLAEDKAEADRKAVRDAARKAEEDAALLRKAEREDADRLAEEARARQDTAKDQFIDASKQASEAKAEGKGAAKQARDIGVDADRTANRADRLDRKLGISTDADHSRTRGDLGSTSSITGRWVQHVADEQALRAVCGPLGEHFREEDLRVAAGKFMATRRDGFKGERVEDPTLPGVVFVWERDTLIRT